MVSGQAKYKEPQDTGNPQCSGSVGKKSLLLFPFFHFCFLFFHCWSLPVRTTFAEFFLAHFGARDGGSFVQSFASRRTLSRRRSRAKNFVRPNGPACTHGPCAIASAINVDLVSVVDEHLVSLLVVLWCGKLIQSHLAVLKLARIILRCLHVTQ